MYFFNDKIKKIGFVIEYGEIFLDTESLKPFKEVAIPHDTKSLNSQVKLVRLWNQSFSLTEDAKSEFKSLESEIKKLVVVVIDESQPLELKTDASDIALPAALNQSGRLVAFFSRTLHGSELKHSPAEKSAITDAVNHWKNFLANHHFTLKLIKSL